MNDWFWFYIFAFIQANNAYIFPGFGLGLIMSGAIRSHDEMLLAACKWIKDLNVTSIANFYVLLAITWNNKLIYILFWVDHIMVLKFNLMILIWEHIGKNDKGIT